MLRQHADIRPACELHTCKLWQSFADPDSYSDCDGAIANTDSNCNCNCYSNSNSNSNCYGNGNGYGYGYGYGNCDRTATVYTDATASSDAATSPVGSGTI